MFNHILLCALAPLAVGASDTTAVTPAEEAELGSSDTTVAPGSALGDSDGSGDGYASAPVPLAGDATDATSEAGFDPKAYFETEEFKAMHAARDEAREAMYDILLADVRTRGEHAEYKFEEPTLFEELAAAESGDASGSGDASASGEGEDRRRFGLRSDMAANINLVYRMADGTVRMAALQDYADLPWKSSKGTKFIIHGFIDSYDKPGQLGIAEAIRNDLRFEGNIVQLDWSQYNNFFQDMFSFDLEHHWNGYTNAVENVIDAGITVAYYLYHIGWRWTLSWHQFHCIGHSLGAQMCGIIGWALDYFYGERIGRITGLDPAGPAWVDDVYSGWCLRREDADFVDIIHTNGMFFRGIAGMVLSNHFGNLRPMGHVDFYPEGGDTMPQCGYLVGPGTWMPFSGLACSHAMAIRFFTETIKGSAYRASLCTGTIEQCVAGQQLNHNKVTLMGMHARVRWEHAEIQPTRWTSNPTRAYYLTTTNHNVAYGWGLPGTSVMCPTTSLESSTGGWNINEITTFSCTTNDLYSGWRSTNGCTSEIVNSDLTTWSENNGVHFTEWAEMDLGTTVTLASVKVYYPYAYNQCVYSVWWKKGYAPWTKACTLPPSSTGFNTCSFTNVGLVSKVRVVKSASSNCWPAHPTDTWFRLTGVQIFSLPAGGSYELKDCDDDGIPDHTWRNGMDFLMMSSADNCMFTRTSCKTHLCDYHYRIPDIDDYSHDGWENKYVLPLYSGLDHIQAEAEYFADQGWGHRKGYVRLEFLDQNWNPLEYLQLFELAPHADSHLPAYSEHYPEVPSSAAFARLQTHVGGGGGHSLHIRGFQVDMYYKCEGSRATGRSESWVQGGHYGNWMTRGLTLGCDVVEVDSLSHVYRGDFSRSILSRYTTHTHGRIDFEVKASNDVHIFIGDAGTTGYEIVIGGWANQYSVIRWGIQATNRVAAGTVGYLSPVSWRMFWIEWNASTLSVGRLGHVAPFMSTPRVANDVVFVMKVAAGYGSNAKFRFCDEVTTGSYFTGAY